MTGEPMFKHTPLAAEARITAFCKAIGEHLYYFDKWQECVHEHASESALKTVEGNLLRTIDNLKTLTKGETDER